MKPLMILVIVGAVLALGFQSARGPASQASMHQGSAATYESLATAIIAIRETEDNLVNGLLTHSFAMAQRECESAIGAQGDARIAHLEAAALEITNIANEGDKQIQAVRQRLLQAGHHHHTDAETKEDYIFINSAEKKALLDLATQVARLGARASDDAIRSAMDALRTTFEAAVQPE